jgi:hypothetical protein
MLIARDYWLWKWRANGRKMPMLAGLTYLKIIASLATSHANSADQCGNLIYKSDKEFL